MKGEGMKKGEGMRKGEEIMKGEETALYRSFLNPVAIG